MEIFLLDDEENARKTVISYLNKYLTNFEITERDSLKEGLEYLKKNQPDLAVLDINLDSGTSFDLLSQLEEINFQVIFISAYDQYAIKAFKYNAIDYILKPINPVELQDALQKATTSIESNNLSKQQLEKLRSDLKQQSIQRITLKDNQSIHFVDIENIVRCKSENNYTVFSLKEGSDLIVSKTLGDFEDLLKERLFFRSHRSHLINLANIKRYDKREGGFIEMCNGDIVPLSRNKKEIFLKVIDQL